MSRLEERYRRVLRLLPAAYRREWEDDMVAAFLASQLTGDPEVDSYAADYGRPSVAEIASVVSLAVRLRLGGVDAAPRPFAWGEAVRVATLAATLTYAVLATTGIAVTAWLSGKLGSVPAPPADWVPAAPSNLWYRAWGFAGYAWLPAFVALVLGHRRAAQAVATLAIVPTAVTTVVGQVRGDQPLSETPWVVLAYDILLVLAMSAFHDSAPPLRRRPWFLALAVGVVAVPVPLTVLQVTTPAAGLLDWPALVSVLVAVVALGNLVGRLAVRRPRATPWPLALTLLAGATLGLRLLTLPGYRFQVDRSALVLAGVAESLVVVLAATPLVAIAVRELRRLPKPGTSATTS